MRTVHYIIVLLGMAIAIGCGGGHSTTTQTFTELRESEAGNQVLTINEVDKARSLEINNRVREEVGLKSKMTWDDKLAGYAEDYLKIMTADGHWGHDPHNYDVTIYDEMVGENLFASSYSPMQPLRLAVDNWANEKQFYTYGDIGDESTCVKGEQCGHYTQLVWMESVRVGCAVGTYLTGQYKGWTLTVCKYSKVGNIRGERPY